MNNAENTWYVVGNDGHFLSSLNTPETWTTSLDTALLFPHDLAIELAARRGDATAKNLVMTLAAAFLTLVDKLAPGAPVVTPPVVVPPVPPVVTPPVAVTPPVPPVPPVVAPPVVAPPVVAPPVVIPPVPPVVTPPVAATPPAGTPAATATSPGSFPPGVSVGLIEGSPLVTFQTPQNVVAGQPVLFALQPGATYQWLTSATGTLSASLDKPYNGPGNLSSVTT